MTTSKPVLIAALSARALAASAKRAGYRPLVVDCFGDQDLAADPADTITLPASVRSGPRARELRSALDQLTARALSAYGQKPLGLVVGSGFEDRPKLLDKLSGHFNYLGTDGSIVNALKQPTTFFALLDQLQIPHPETRTDPSGALEGWLSKRIGASGGLHIRPNRSTDRPRPSRYVQRSVAGRPISVLGIVSTAGTALAVSEQWTSPSPKFPYRFGGAVSNPVLPANVEQDLLEAALALTESAPLRGMVSIDFMVSDSQINCLEINPRPSATLDIFDDDQGTLFSAHMLACQGENPAAFMQRHWKVGGAKAHAYLYADQGPLTVSMQTWPDWAHDRPRPGTIINTGQPLASVSATATTAQQARQFCIERLATLEKMLYDKEKTDTSGKDHAS